MDAALRRPRPTPPPTVGPQRAAAVLRAYDLRPRKGLGQHFLVDESYLARIVEAAEIEPDDTVLEVGPGLGVLTAALCRRAGRVVAVEIDAAMRAVLADRLCAADNLQVVAADILRCDPVALLDGTAPADAVVPAARDGSGAAGTPKAAAVRRFGPLRPHYKVVANLPYYITSAVLRRVLEARERPVRAVVMVQKEVADRATAAPGDMSVLAVALQLHAAVRRIAIVPPGAFHPPPKVASAILRLDLHAAPPVPLPDVDVFFRAVRAGFGQKRKQLKNSLAAGLGLPDADAAAILAAAGVAPQRRAQTLSLAEWSSVAIAALERGLPAPAHGGPAPADGDGWT